MLHWIAENLWKFGTVEIRKEHEYEQKWNHTGETCKNDWSEKGIELNQTDSIKKLMKNMNLTIDQAMNALEVPEDKREKYRKTITPDNWLIKNPVALSHFKSMRRDFYHFKYHWK